MPQTLPAVPHAFDVVEEPIVARARPKAVHSVRQWIGLAIVAAGALALMAQFWQFVRADPVVWNALLGGSVAALATALGTLPVVFSQ